MGGFRDKIARFMYGRYGTDQLNRFLSAVTLILLIVSIFTKWRAFYWLAVAGLILVYFRMLSRNIMRRRAENDKYLALTARFRKGFSGAKRRRQDKTHAYFLCPNCKQQVRVPKGKGKISITCPKCKTEFIKKT